MESTAKDISHLPNVQIKTEPGLSEVPDKATILALLNIVRKYKLKGTEEMLMKEAKISNTTITQGSDSEVSSVLSTYKTDGNPDLYEDSYLDLKKFVDSSLDAYKHEIGMILFPVFVHMYLELVYNSHEEQAVKFMDRFGKDQEYYYKDDIQRISLVTKKEQMSGSEFAVTLRSNQFIIRMSRDTLATLKKHLQEKKSIVLNIVQEHLYFDVYEGVSRTKAQVDSVSGSFVGEATRQDNKARVFYGLPREPDYQYAAADDEDDEADGDKPKKKKQKKESFFNKKLKTDPNAPPVDRISFPELKDNDKAEKIKSLREASKRVNLGSENLPSACCYTLLNTDHSVNCAEISDDSSILAAGFSNSIVRVWTLMPQKLKSMKTGEQLQDIDHEADDVWARIMDEKNAELSRTLYGHAGPVYGVSISPDKTLLLSCSEDSTVRLWSLLTWTCLVAYKGHVFPVWDVKFSPHGYYFVSGGHDKTARLWATDHHQPLRIFVGHFSDVDKVQFHPNSNYVATGSSDKTIRLWDCFSGNHVRVMTGHKATIQSLSFSVEGRFLASADDSRVLLWDIAHGHLLADLKSHSAPTHSLSFSRDGTILASGSLDCTLKLWDFSKLTEDVSIEDVNVTHNPDIRTDTEKYLLRTFSTKSSPLISLQFSRRNVLITVAVFDSEM